MDEPSKEQEYRQEAERLACCHAKTKPSSPTSSQQSRL